MKNILVPVDFTRVALNALKYAYNAFPEAKIHALHVVPSALNTTEVEYSLLNRVKVVKDGMEEELKKIIKLELGLGYIPNNISTTIMKGETITQIKNYMKEDSFDCILMGTRDKYSLFEKLIGTVSLAVIKQSQIPTFLVPKHAEYKPYKKVLVASDYHILHNKIGSWIKEWNQPFKAFIRFLHIQNKDESFMNETDQLVKELFDNSDPDFGFEVKNVNSNKIAPTLLESAYGFGADLLISMPDKQNFFSAILLKNVTKELVEKSSIPLLFIPNKIL